MLKVSIIGSGNVALHLAKAFSANEKINLVQLFSRSAIDSDFGIDQHKIVHDLAKLDHADLYIIAVSDAAIEEVAANLSFKGKLVAHTSGAIGLSAIDPKNRGSIFYPLQTFSKSKKVDFKKVPICIESQFAADIEVLKEVANAISDHVKLMNSDQRLALHVAAVFACNFTNHMYVLANEVCQKNNIDFEILKPLIVETADKVLQITPEMAQTGPAKRNDQITMQKHLSFLDDNLQKIYSQLSNSISDHGKKL